MLDRCSLGESVERLPAVQLPGLRSRKLPALPVLGISTLPTCWPAVAPLSACCGLLCSASCPASSGTCNGWVSYLACILSKLWRDCMSPSCLVASADHSRQELRPGRALASGLASPASAACGLVRTGEYCRRALPLLPSALPLMPLTTGSVSTWAIFALLTVTTPAAMAAEPARPRIVSLSCRRVTPNTCAHSTCPQQRLSQVTAQAALEHSSDAFD